MSKISRHGDYRQVLESIRQRIQASQTRVIVEQMALDSRAVYPGMKGFSRTSLFAMRQFYAFFNPQFEFVPQAAGQMPWGHVRSRLDKAKSLDVEYALRDIHKPMGVSSFITKDIPLSVQSQLPSVEEIESELAQGYGETKQ